MMIPTLRDLLHGDPSQDLFLKVLDLVRANPSQEVIDYALGHLDSWKYQNLRFLRRFDLLSFDPSWILVRYLDLWGKNIGSEGVAALAASPHIKNLTFLDLSWNNICPEGAAALVAAPHLKNTEVTLQ